jgi:hypothetical protein
VDIGEEPIDHLQLHAEIPITFLVESVLEVSILDGGLGGLRLSETPVAEPWVKPRRPRSRGPSPTGLFQGEVTS